MLDKFWKSSLSSLKKSFARLEDCIGNNLAFSESSLEGVESKTTILKSKFGANFEQIVHVALQKRNLAYLVWLWLV